MLVKMAMIFSDISYERIQSSVYPGPCQKCLLKGHKDCAISKCGDLDLCDFCYFVRDIKKDVIKKHKILKCCRSENNRECRLFVKRLEVGIPNKGTCRRCFLHDPSNVNSCDHRDNRVKYFYYHSDRKINIVNLCTKFRPGDKYRYIMTSIK